MKIYFTASTTQKSDFNPNYTWIITQLKKCQVLLTSGEQIVNKEQLIKDQMLSSEEIYKRQIALIDQSDAVIAEVTTPSSGVGGEIMYALTTGKPVLALIFKDNDDKVSRLITGNPSENFYLEHYDFDNLQYVCNDFLQHMNNLQEKKGKFIVIDGGEGSGKATQAELLVGHFKKKKLPVKYYDFPRYYSSFHGDTVARFLRGEFGSMGEVSPYLASLAYALDRASVKTEMEIFLKKGGYIIANRYASSNMAHQGAKFSDENERNKFLKWVYDLEYKVHKIPKEDIVIYLYVPWEKGIELTNKKTERKYLKGGRDIAEEDVRHRIDSESMYLQLAKQKKNWIKIDCIEHGELLPSEKIHERILKALEI